jgi:hypothetical protein
VRVAVAVGLAAVGVTIGVGLPAAPVGLPAGAVPVTPAVGLAAAPVGLAAGAVAVGVVGVPSEPPSPAMAKARMKVTSTTTSSIPTSSGPMGRSLQSMRDIPPPQRADSSAFSISARVLALLTA